MADNLTIRKLKNTRFIEIYISCMYIEKNVAKLLPYAVLFLNCKDSIIKLLGYSIILRYSISTKDYIPLYETAFNNGLFPICNVIYQKLIGTKRKETFMSEWLASFTQLACMNDTIRTIEQINLNEFFLKELKNDSCIIAPTSYGKSELIITLIENAEQKNLCILVPTKALISQTRRLIKNYVNKKELQSDWLIITHPDMYINNTKGKKVIAIFTQERLMRCINQFKELIFDFLVVDEAHELLEDNNRSQLEALVILCLKKINAEIKVKYLTPFIFNSENLGIKYSEFSISEFKVDEVVKIPRYQYIDLYSKEVYIYDQFLGKFIPHEEDIKLSDNPEDFVIRNKTSAKKILVYLNKSKDLEQCALNLASKRSAIKNPLIDEICKSLQTQLHGDYNLIRCLQHGVLYHHGSIPDNIRSFIEYIYSDIPEINYLVTSSTLLQGMNLPIDELYLLDKKRGNSNLSGSSFKNLVGRVSRFKDIFKKAHGELSLLEPSIYIIKSSYGGKNSNFKNFIENVADENKNLTDKVSNKMLRGVATSNDADIQGLENIIENKFPGTVSCFERPLLQTQIGKICAENGFNEFDLYQYEREMQTYCNDHVNNIDTVSDLIEAIYYIFIRFLPDSSRSNSKRLKEIEAQKFYTMLLEKRLNNVSYKELINFFVKYWKRRIEYKSPIVYVGQKWGDISIDGSYGNKYIDVSKLSQTKLINLAIVRIKEEEDFIEYSIIRYAELLKSASLIDSDFYLKLKYGSTDKDIIGLIQLGFSPYLARFITNKFSDFIEYNDGVVSGVKSSILDVLQYTSINPLQRYEIRSKL